MCLYELEQKSPTKPPFRVAKAPSKKRSASSPPRYLGRSLEWVPAIVDIGVEDHGYVGSGPVHTRGLPLDIQRIEQHLIDSPPSKLKSPE